MSETTEARPTPSSGAQMKKRDLLEALASLVIELNDAKTHMRELHKKLAHQSDRFDDILAENERLTAALYEKELSSLSEAQCSTFLKTVSAESGSKGGAVVSEHGPCEDGSIFVRDMLEHVSMPPELERYIRARLSAGEEKYGKPLRFGWKSARGALSEELADSIAYAIAADRKSIASRLVGIWEDL